LQVVHRTQPWGRLPADTDYAAATVLDLEALRRLAGAYYFVTQILRDARNTIPGASAV